MDQTKKNEKPYKCPKCYKSFNVGTDLVQHLHDHNNTKDRHYQCKHYNADKYLVYVHYEQPNKRIFGVHCMDCFKEFVPSDKVFEY